MPCARSWRDDWFVKDVVFSTGSCIVSMGGVSCIVWCRTWCIGMTDVKMLIAFSKIREISEIERCVFWRPPWFGGPNRTILRPASTFLADAGMVRGGAKGGMDGMEKWTVMCKESRWVVTVFNPFGDGLCFFHDWCIKDILFSTGSCMISMGGVFCIVGCGTRYIGMNDVKMSIAFSKIREISEAERCVFWRPHWFGGPNRIIVRPANTFEAETGTVRGGVKEGMGGSKEKWTVMCKESSWVVTVFNPPGDGLCFFHCIAKWFKIHKKLDVSAVQVQKQIIRRMIKNRKKLENLYGWTTEKWMRVLRKRMDDRCELRKWNNKVFDVIREWAPGSLNMQIETYKVTAEREGIKVYERMEKAAASGVEAIKLWNWRNHFFLEVENRSEWPDERKHVRKRRAEEPVRARKQGEKDWERAENRVGANADWEQTVCASQGESDAMDVDVSLTEERQVESGSEKRGNGVPVLDEEMKSTREERIERTIQSDVRWWRECEAQERGANSSAVVEGERSQTMEKSMDVDVTTKEKGDVTEKITQEVNGEMDVDDVARNTEVKRKRCTAWRNVKLSFVSQNMRSTGGYKDMKLIDLFEKESKYGCICMQETWERSRNARKKIDYARIGGWRKFALAASMPEENRHGGIAIWTRLPPGLRCKASIVDSNGVMKVRIWNTMQNEKWCVVNAYCPTGRNKMEKCGREKMEDAVNEALKVGVSQNMETVFCGDWNTSWNRWRKLAGARGLVVVAEACVRNGEQMIDNMMVSGRTVEMRKVEAKVEKWSKGIGSDHEALKMDVEARCGESPNTRFKLGYNQERVAEVLDDFVKALREKLRRSMRRDATNSQKVRSVHKAMESVATTMKCWKVCGSNTWTTNVGLPRRIKNVVKEYRKAKADGRREESLKMRTRVVREVAKEKAREEERWRMRLQKKYATKMKAVHSMILSKPRAGRLVVVRDEHGVLTSDGETVKARVRKVIGERWMIPRVRSTDRVTREMWRAQGEAIREAVGDRMGECGCTPSQREVAEAFSKLGRKKACGGDWLTREVVEMMPSSIKRIFEDRVKTIFEYQRWENDECDVEITLLKKDSKKDDEALENYRPISLMNFVAKWVMEILAIRFQRIEKFISNYAFKRGSGTVEAAMMIRAKMEEAKLRGMKYHIMTVDFAKAYDKVRIDMINEAMEYFGICRSVRRMVIGMHNSRRMKIRTGHGLTEPIRPKCGLAQGSPLSCVLFNMVVQLLLNKLNEAMNNGRDGEIVAYADDITIIAHNAAKADEAWRTVKSFVSYAGLELNMNKCEYIFSGPECKRAKAAEQVCCMRKGAATRVLGHWFSQALDGGKQKSTADEVIAAAGRAIVGKRVPGAIATQMLNTIVGAKLRYLAPMACWNVRDGAKWNAKCNWIVKRASRIPRSINNCFVASKEYGLGLIDMARAVDTTNITEYWFHADSRAFRRLAKIMGANRERVCAIMKCDPRSLDGDTLKRKASKMKWNSFVNVLMAMKRRGLSCNDEDGRIDNWMKSKVRVDAECRNGYADVLRTGDWVYCKENDERTGMAEEIGQDGYVINGIDGRRKKRRMEKRMGKVRGTGMLRDGWMLEVRAVDQEEGFIRAIETNWWPKLFNSKWRENRSIIGKVDMEEVSKYDRVYVSSREVARHCGIAERNVIRRELAEQWDGVYYANDELTTEKLVGIETKWNQEVTGSEKLWRVTKWIRPSAAYRSNGAEIKEVRVPCECARIENPDIGKKRRATEKVIRWLERGEEVVAYTDGSWKDGGGGCGIHVVNVERKESKGLAWRVDCVKSSTGAELIPLLLLLKWADSKKKSTIRVRCDSSAAIQIFKRCQESYINERWLWRHRENAIIRRMREIVEADPEKIKRFKVSKVASHTGISGNEVADALAEIGRKGDGLKFDASLLIASTCMIYTNGVAMTGCKALDKIERDKSEKKWMEMKCQGEWRREIGKSAAKGVCSAWTARCNNVTNLVWTARAKNGYCRWRKYLCAGAENRNMCQDNMKCALCGSIMQNGHEFTCRKPLRQRELNKVVAGWMGMNKEWDAMNRRYFILSACAAEKKDPLSFWMGRCVPIGENRVDDVKDAERIGVEKKGGGGRCRIEYRCFGARRRLDTAIKEDKIEQKRRMREAKRRRKEREAKWKASWRRLVMTGGKRISDGYYEEMGKTEQQHRSETGREERGEGSRKRKRTTRTQDDCDTVRRKRRRKNNRETVSKSHERCDRLNVDGGSIIARMGIG